MLLCTRIIFRVTISLDAQLALSVKPVPCRQEVKQNHAEIFAEWRWTILVLTHIVIPLEHPCVFTGHTQDCPRNDSFNYCRKDIQQLDIIFLILGVIIYSRVLIL